MTAAIEVTRLVKSFGTVCAVDDVSFQVEPGETVALLGPNASGKTTTLRCVAGLSRPDSGRVVVAGNDLERHPRDARRTFAFLPQHASFPGSVTVREVLWFHARLRGVDESRVDAALRQAGLDGGVESRRVDELSGGMRQRLALAVAALPDCQVMLLDEPTASLDPQAAIRFRELAGEWRSQGRVLLLSTHVLDDVQELADRVVVLVEGRLVVNEDVGELRARLRRYALLRVDVGTPRPEHVDAALAAGATGARLNHHAVIVTAPVEARYPILRRLEEIGPVRHFETEEPSLEHLYMETVKEKRHAITSP